MTERGVDPAGAMVVKGLREDEKEYVGARFFVCGPLLNALWTTGSARYFMVYLDLAKTDSIFRYRVSAVNGFTMY